jgi:hypothetical protein
MKQLLAPANKQRAHDGFLVNDFTSGGLPETHRRVKTAIARLHRGRFGIKGKKWKAIQRFTCSMSAKAT